MSNDNQNIVDADVEVLDLDELQEAVGGAAPRRVVFDPGAIKLPRPIIQPILRPKLPGGVLIENDGWQGNIFNSNLTTLLRG